MSCSSSSQFPVPIIAPLKIYSLLLCHFFLLSLCCAPSSSPTLLLCLPASKSGDLDGAVNGEPPTQKEGDDDDDASMSMWSVCRPVNVPCVIMKAFRETREVGFSWRCAIIVTHSFTLSSSQRVEIWMAHCWWNQHKRRTMIMIMMTSTSMWSAFAGRSMCHHEGIKSRETREVG